MAFEAMIKDKVAQLPDTPGVYFFKDSSGAIIYIGKAKSLKKRVSSYFNRKLDGKTQALVARIADLEVRLVSTEVQAQILEAALIKEYQPHYNIELKDDKSFPWVRITDEAFPVLSVCRRKRIDPHDTATYFGPYTSAILLREALTIIRKLFGFRTCRVMPQEPCLYHRLTLCPAPCAGKISAAEYGQVIRRIGLFLDSKYDELVQALTKRMLAASRERRYEEAAALRDQINALGAMSKRPQANSGLNELEALQYLLKLKKPPLRIEGFDISNISGKEATGSMVSFYKGRPDKDNYRRFRIKTVSWVDDYDMLREVVRRRYRRLRQERKPLPDLVLIDGGRGHIMAARAELIKLGALVPLVSIAKEEEKIYSNDNQEPVQLKESDPALNLIRRVRDEAHRFARAYHHLLRRKKIIGR